MSEDFSHFMERLWGEENETPEQTEDTQARIQKISEQMKLIAESQETAAKFAEVKQHLLHTFLKIEEVYDVSDAERSQATFPKPETIYEQLTFFWAYLQERPTERIVDDFSDPEASEWTVRRDPIPESHLQMTNYGDISCFIPRGLQGPFSSSMVKIDYSQVINPAPRLTTVSLTMNKYDNETDTYPRLTKIAMQFGPGGYNLTCSVAENWEQAVSDFKQVSYQIGNDGKIIA